MSLALLELAAESLGPILEEVAFVGGATLVLWQDEPGAPEPRPTIDVDVVCDVATHSEYNALRERLGERGFTEVIDEPVICRWHHRASRLILDVMPTNPQILGFTNAWYASGLAAAIATPLPSGRVIHAFDPPHLLATKLAAWNGRGRDDLLASADAADVLTLVNGRSTLISEIASASPELQRFVSTEVGALLEHRDFDYAILDASSEYGSAQAERAQIIRERMSAIAAIT